MNKICAFILMILAAPFLISAQTADDNKVYAPFISRLTAEAKGTGVLLTWKDAANLREPSYHIYASERNISEGTFLYARKIATVGSGNESYLFEPGDSVPRYYLILAEDEGKLFDVFIPYRNLTMASVSAERVIIEEEKAARISNLTVAPKTRKLLISADTTDPGRAHILFRSSRPLNGRDDLSEATRVRVFVNETIEMEDQVIPGIPFYYALVDRELYESGSTILLYDGSVTIEPVTVALEDYTPETAHSFKFVSSHIPLPLLNVELDIESGRKLPDPGVPIVDTPLSEEASLALASLDYGKSVHSPLWKQPALLPVDKSPQSPPETSWVKTYMESGDWKGLEQRCEASLKTSFDNEIRDRLHFYKGQAHYFGGELEKAFMDFLSSRDGYYAESNEWLFSIYEQRLKITRSQGIE